MSRIRLPENHAPENSSPENPTRKSAAAARRAKRKRAQARQKSARPRNAEDATAPGRRMHPRVFAATWFSFHRFCAEGFCRRTQRCTGGADPPCFHAFWRHVPTPEKLRFQVTLIERSKGADVAQAIAAGNAAAERCEAEDAMDTAQAETAREPAAPPLPAQPLIVKRAAQPPVARVRSL